VPAISSINVKPAEDKVTVEGVLTTRLIYECEEKAFHAHLAEVPFSVNVKLDGATANSNITAHAAPLSCNVKARRGKELLVDARIALSVGAQMAEKTQILSNLTANGANAENTTAIVIHTALAGETIWDIAKKTNVPTSEIIRQHGEPVPGDRVVLYRKACRC
jgi:LysM repeat protein